MTLTTTIFAIGLFLATVLWFYLNQFRNYVYSLGIPIDRKIIWAMHKLNFRKKMVEDLNKFGKLWVEYNGTTPIINIADPDLIKEVMVKHFDSFTNRQHLGVEEAHTSLIDAKDDVWSITRRALSPTFSSGKLKGMTSHMDRIADNMIDHLQDLVKKNGSIVNV